MEYKILNTLWTKQVNKYPDLSKWFTLKISFGDPNQQEIYYLAGAKLVAEGLARITAEGHYLLTSEGFGYCKEHHKEFLADQWWAGEQISQENLRKVLAGEAQH